MTSEPSTHDQYAGKRPTATMPHRRDLADIGNAWGTLASTDPLWAIYVDPARRHGRWDPEAFYASGEAEVAHALSRAEGLGMPVSGGKALDFGCGAGRLTRPLAARFELAVGVDIAQEMLDLAARDNPVASRCQFVRNTEPDLRVFGDREFDLVYSCFVLQHLPPRLAAAYLAEFARVLRPGGSLIVDLPTRTRRNLKGMGYLLLPPAALGFVQRRLLGYPAPMRMHGMPEHRVRAWLAAHNVDVLAAEPESRHPGWYMLRYFAQRHP